MTQKILIIGGCGRIGSSVAQDLTNHTQAKIIVTACQQTKGKQLTEKFQFLPLDLSNFDALKAAIKNVNLVIHCAGPFHYRDGRVLKTCIEQGVDYLDVSDHRCFYEQVISWHNEAVTAGVTAILNTGVFPGISNSMVRQAVEKLDRPQKIKLSYVVAGSGGAGLTVMRTTFLGLRTPFYAWIDNQWQQVLPYSEREAIEFPPPYGKTGVYWFDVAETGTFAHSFPVDTVITKFGSVPNFYNHLTWLTAHIFPHKLITSSQGIEFLSKVSYLMTKVTDKFSGIGVAMQAEVKGKKDGKSACAYGTFVHENTAIAAGFGTGSIAQLMIEGKLKKPGIYPVEKALPTDLFEQAMEHRGIEIQQKLVTEST